MRALVVAVMAGLALSVGGPASGGSAAPTAIVDRTWSCPLRTSDGFRLVTIWGIDAVAGYEHDASMRVEDGLAASPAAQLVSVTSTEVRVNRRCAAARGIQLGHRGLPGPPGIFLSTYDCESKPTKVVIRVRASVPRTGPFRRQGNSLVLKRTVSRAELSVRAPSGRPFAYVTIADKKMRIWSSPNCVRD